MEQLTPHCRHDDGALILSFAEYPGQEFDLGACQGDNPQKLRIYLDKHGALLTASGGFWLVAEVDIPARSWAAVPVTDDAGEPVLDENGAPETRQEPAVPAVDDVRIIMWNLREVTDGH